MIRKVHLAREAQIWGDGLGGGSLGGRRHPVRQSLFRGIPPAFLCCSVSCFSENARLQGPRHPDKSHSSESKGTDKQGSLLR